jgi:hypothetical protein
VIVHDQHAHRRRNDVKQAEREESANPSRVVQVADSDDRDRERDSEGDR